MSGGTQQWAWGRELRTGWESASPPGTGGVGRLAWSTGRMAKPGESNGLCSVTCTAARAVSDPGVSCPCPLLGVLGTREAQPSTPAVQARWPRTLSFHGDVAVTFDGSV